VTREELLLLLQPGLFVLGALLCLLFEAAGTPLGARKRGARTPIALLALGTCAAVALQAAATFGDAQVPTAAFKGAISFDLMGQLATAGVALIVALTIGASVPGLREIDGEHGDEYALLLLCGAGMSTLVVATDLLVVAGALALISASVMALCALDRAAEQGAEAAVKLVKVNGVWLALLGFAAALRYGATGDTALALRALDAPPGMLWLAGALALVVVLGQLGATPLHVTRVDVLHGAPPFVGGLVGAGGVLAGGVLLVRLLTAGEGELPDGVTTLVSAVALLSLVVPPIAALDQTRLARVVGYLVCAQAGPVIVAALVLSGDTGAAAPGLASVGGANGAVVLALSAGAIASAGAVFALAFLQRAGSEGSTWEGWSGAGRVHPVFSLALLWLWASLAGVPGTAGFSARVVVAQASFAAGEDLLGLFVVLAPAIATAAVLRLTIFLFAKEPDRALEIKVSGWHAVVLAVACVLVGVLGIFPTPLLDLTAVASLLPGVDGALP